MKFLSIALLSLVISIVSIPLLVGQNPNVLPPQIAVSGAAPNGSFTISSNGDVEIGTSNGLGLFQLATGNYALANNLISSSGNFKYMTTGVADVIQFAAGDIYLRTMISGNAGVVPTPRTALLIKNGAPDGSMLLDATGNLTMPVLKSTTGTRYVCVDTTGKLISSATACSGT